MELLVFMVVVSAIASMALGAWVSIQKNRAPEEGMVLGLLFGPFGVLIAALVPTRPEPTPEEKAAAIAAEQARLVARARAESAAFARRMKEQEANYEKAEKAAAAQRAAYYKSRGIEPGPLAWFLVLPAWLQVVLGGLAVGGLVSALTAMFVLGWSAAPEAQATAPPSAVEAAPAHPPASAAP